MSDSACVSVLTTSVMGVLSRSARYKLFDVAKKQCANSCGSVSELVYLPDSEDHILRKSNVAVGLSSMGIYGENAYNNTIGSIVVGQSSRLDRIELIALRTALLYSFRYDNIIIYAEHGCGVEVHMDAIMEGATTASITSSYAISDSLRDICEECIDIISLRKQRGKTTLIKSLGRDGFAGIMRDLRRNAVSMHGGNADFVVHDRYMNRDNDRTERLRESAQQAGVESAIGLMQN